MVHFFRQPGCQFPCTYLNLSICERHVSTSMYALLTCIILSHVLFPQHFCHLMRWLRHMSSSLKSVKVSVDGRSIHVVRRGNGPKVLNSSNTDKVGWSQLWLYMQIRLFMGRQRLTPIGCFADARSPWYSHYRHATSDWGWCQHYWGTASIFLKWLLIFEITENHLYFIFEGLCPQTFSLVGWDPPGYGDSRPPARDFKDYSSEQHRKRHR